MAASPAKCTARQDERQERLCCCVSTARWQLAHGSVTSTVFLTNPKRGTVQASVKKVSSVLDKTGMERRGPIVLISQKEFILVIYYLCWGTLYSQVFLPRTGGL